MLFNEPLSGNGELAGGNVALAARRDEDAQAMLVARGALYAARVNALVRKKTGGKRSVDQVVLELRSQGDVALDRQRRPRLDSAVDERTELEGFLHQRPQTRRERLYGWAHSVVPSPYTNPTGKA